MNTMKTETVIDPTSYEGQCLAAMGILADGATFDVTDDRGIVMYTGIAQEGKYYRLKGNEAVYFAPVGAPDWSGSL